MNEFANIELKQRPKRIIYDESESEQVLNETLNNLITDSECSSL